MLYQSKEYIIYHGGIIRICTKFLRDRSFTFKGRGNVLRLSTSFYSKKKKGASSSWLFDSWIYYRYNQYLSPLMWVRTRSWRGVLATTSCDKVCQWRATGGWFSPYTPVSSTNKTDRHDITEILLNVTLNIINQTKKYIIHDCFNNFSQSLSNAYSMRIMYFEWLCFIKNVNY